MPQAVHLGICLHDVICLIQSLAVIENSILCRFLICHNILYGGSIDITKKSCAIRYNYKDTKP
jgi:hypothetical protein